MPKEVRIILADTVERLVDDQVVRCREWDSRKKLEEEILSTAKIITGEDIMKILEKVKWEYGKQVLEGSKNYMNGLEIAILQAAAILEYISGGKG